MSPFLCFAVAVHGTRAYLDTTSYVEERWAPRRRIPVFDVAPLRDLLSDPARRLFLAELLGSYTHVSSGATWERTPARLATPAFQRTGPGAPGRAPRGCEARGTGRHLPPPGRLGAVHDRCVPATIRRACHGPVGGQQAAAHVGASTRWGRRTGPGAARPARAALVVDGGPVGPGPRGADDARAGARGGDGRAVSPRRAGSSTWSRTGTCSRFARAGSECRDEDQKLSSPACRRSP